ncbi:hypothetical protein QMO37_32160, partial [Pseudomonas aeruginosa]|nr:hypothetical protein [Pseudomonas aeruginosa]
AGAGFYDYPANGRKHLWAELKSRFEKPDAQISAEDVRDRLLFIQAIETVRCVEEGVLHSTADANIGSIFGIGFAAWSGGAYMGEEALQQGIKVRTSSFTRHHVNISMTRAKSNGAYINSMLALQEAISGGADEA